MSNAAVLPATELKNRKKKKKQKQILNSTRISNN